MTVDRTFPCRAKLLPFPRMFEESQTARLTVAVDVDEVVAELLPAWLAAYNRDYFDTLTPRDIRVWDLTASVKPECGASIYTYLDTPKLYDSVQPVADALRGIETLRAWGHKVIFVTSAMNGHAGAKLRWLQKHGFLNAALRVDPSYVECSDKSLIAADVLVDDRPKNIEDFPNRTILYAAPHNADCDAPDATARDWSEVCQAVESMAYESKITSDNMLSVLRAQVTSTTENGECDVRRPYGASIMDLLRPANAQPSVVETVGDAESIADATGDPASSTDLPHAGVKFDKGKPRFDLLPSWPLWLVSLVYTFGAEKYDDHNWRKGMRWGRVMAATERHIARWKAHQDNATDSGLHHLAHAAFGLLTLIEYAVIAPEFDDRPTRVAQIPEEGETLPSLFATPAAADL